MAIIISVGISQAYASDQKRAEAQALIDRVEQRSNLVGITIPYLYVASVEHSFGKDHRAKYMQVRAANGEVRELAEVNDSGEQRIRKASELWMPAEPNPKLDFVFSWGHEFPFGGSLLRSTEQLTGVRHSKLKGKEFWCVVAQRGISERELCVDPATGLLARINYPAKVTKMYASTQARPEGDTVEFLNYKELGNKAVPGVIRHFRKGHPIAEIRMLQLEANPSSTSSAGFTVPAGYESWPTCDQYESASVSEPLRLTGVDRNSIRAAEAVRVVVATDGKAKEVRLLNPTGKNPKPLISAFQRQRYIPANCGGKAVLGYMTLHLDW